MKMFKKKKYEVIRQALSKELSNFIFNYMMLQRDAVDFLMKHNKVNPANPFMGNRVDKQIPGCYTKYADWVMETLLQYMRPIMKTKTGMDLVPTYSYTRLYEKGNILKRHKDRPSCEISTTMHLGGDEWSIYLDPTNPETRLENVPYKIIGNKGVRIDLKPGDMLVYSGCELEHWREKFKGKECVQVFLHYNNRKTPGAKNNMFDKRPHLGLPSWFKR